MRACQSVATARWTVPSRDGVAGYGGARSPARLPAPAPAASRYQPARATRRAALPRSSSSSSSSSDADAVPAAASTYRATVTENRGESGDGAFRTLRLSVADDVPLLSGGVRPSVRSKPAGRRFIDGYKVPGQQVEVRLVEEGGGGPGATRPALPPPRRLVLASSPYEALRESSALAASIIELLVDREAEGDALSAALGRLAPGDQLDVSGVVGSGWAPLFDAMGSDDDHHARGRAGGGAAGSGSSALAAALEARRPLLVVGAGAAGAAALRSTLEWTPVQAAASAGRVAAVLAAGRGSADRAGTPGAAPPDDAHTGLGGAPYLIWYELWRGWGVRLATPPPLAPGAGALALEAQLFGALFGGGGDPGALRSVMGGGGGGGGGDGGGVTVLLGGLPRPVALAIVRRLEAEGVPSSQVLFGDPYF